MKEENNSETLTSIKIIPVKNTVLFPHNIMPFTAGKEWTSKVSEKAVRIGSKVGIINQKDGKVANPKPDDLYEIGTEAKVLKVIRFPDNSFGAVVHGLRRFRVERYIKAEGEHLVAEISYLKEDGPKEHSLDVLALAKAMKQLVQKAVKLSPNIPQEANLFIENVQDPSYLIDLIIPYLSIDAQTKQSLLEIEDLQTRLQKTHFFLAQEVEVLEISHKINSDVKSEVSKQQRKYFVREQIKILQKELGEIEGRPGAAGGSSVSSGNELEDLVQKLGESKISQEGRLAAQKELDRMHMMQPSSPEYIVSHTYVNWLLDMPWDIYNQQEINLPVAKSTLDADHFGLEKVKKRILDFLAVYSLKKSLKGPILLFVGPPGVGKTSLGKSIAQALGRKFIRIALGGVHDEAEVRGHRRTYVGSMPGKIADALKKANSMDPVILLDEIDKLSSDHRGDPTSALLEVLDPEQNHTFLDHYLNINLDLSKIFFIATANNLQTIPAPLRDRMEIVELGGYTVDEKTHIAFEHLLPQVKEENGLNEIADITFPKEVMQELIQNYTREAGVRQLKRELSSVARNIAREIVEKNAVTPKKTKKQKKDALFSKKLDSAILKNYLGISPYSSKKAPKNLPSGVAIGLAWTPVGGDILYIESAAIAPGHGKFEVTGQLGDVMKESVKIAHSFLRANATLCGVKAQSMAKKDLHLHFPEGAVKKDGPSAGVAIFLGMTSLFSNRTLPSDLAMTGEISLRGDVLPVGGIKEKILAAHRSGIKKVLIPLENKKDLEDIPADVLKQLKVTPIRSLKEALAIAFQ